MNNKYKIITLCGSVDFKDTFLEIEKKLVSEGNIVLSQEWQFTKDAIQFKPLKDMLDGMHLAKIDISDEIYVINVDGYIEESTKKQIEYASFKGKIIKYLEKPTRKDGGIPVDEIPVAKCDYDPFTISCPNCNTNYRLTTEDVKNNKSKDIIKTCINCNTVYKLPSRLYINFR